jgi:hypothetical protein
VYFARGLAYEKLGNNKRAIEDAKSAAKLGNGDAQSYLKAKGIEW